MHCSTFDLYYYKSWKTMQSKCNQKCKFITVTFTTDHVVSWCVELFYCNFLWRMRVHIVDWQIKRRNILTYVTLSNPHSSKIIDEVFIVYLLSTIFHIKAVTIHSCHDRIDSIRFIIHLFRPIRLQFITQSAI